MEILGGGGVNGAYGDDSWLTRAGQCIPRSYASMMPALEVSHPLLVPIIPTEIKTEIAQNRRSWPASNSRPSSSSPSSSASPCRATSRPGRRRTRRRASRSAASYRSPCSLQHVALCHVHLRPTAAIRTDVEGDVAAVRGQPAGVNDNRRGDHEPDRQAARQHNAADGPATRPRTLRCRQPLCATRLPRTVHAAGRFRAVGNFNAQYPDGGKARDGWVWREMAAAITRRAQPGWGQGRGRLVWEKGLTCLLVQRPD